MSYDVSVVIISDYKAGDDKSWNDMRKTLTALREQDYTGRVQYLLIEEERFANAIPEDVKAILPDLEIKLGQGESSYELANEGVEAAAADLVVLLDADCTPSAGWLSSYMEAAAARPDAAVISGRTRYPDFGFTARCLALLSRGYVDAGGRDTTHHISNNNAGYRRDAYLAHPLPTNAGVYAARLQADAMTRAGLTLLFEPGMDVIHDYEGWAMERDARRYTGWGSVTVRKLEPRTPYAWMVRLGVLGVPVLVLSRLLQSLWLSTTLGRHYGIRLWQLPAAWALASYVHLLEIPGMVRAMTGQPVGETVYR